MFQIKNIKVIMFVLIVCLFSNLFTSAVNHDHIDKKIRNELWDKINKEKYGFAFIKDSINELYNPDSRIETVLIKYDEKDTNKTDIVLRELENKKYKVIGNFDIGNIIVAEIPIEKIEEVSKNKYIDSIWPEREFQAELDFSVPQINAELMWDSGFDGSGIKIAILDTGVNKNHEMLNGKVILERDFTGGGHARDIYGHGTHVAGIAAGDGSLKGVATGASIINSKVLDDEGRGYTSWIVAGINWSLDPDGDPLTDDGADIISMSLGGSYQDLGSPLVTAVRDAVNRGAVVVVSAGNCGPACPSSSCDGFMGVKTPGITPEAITVGAVNDTDGWACFSSGEDISGVGIKPDVVAPGVGIRSAIWYGGTVSYSGTSMSAPHVTGACALLLQANPNLTPEDVKYIIEKTALDLGDFGKDAKYGSGRLDLSNFENLLNIISNYDKTEIDLLKGWNLVSFPLVPINDSIEYLFKEYFNHKIISWFDSKKNVTNISNIQFMNGNNLFSMEYGNGYWIKTDRNQTLIVYGNFLNSTNITLFQGYNYVGNSNQIKDLPALSGEVVVWNYDELTGVWRVYNNDLDFSLNTISSLNPKEGYIVYSGVEQGFLV